MQPPEGTARAPSAPPTPEPSETETTNPDDGTDAEASAAFDLANLEFAEQAGSQTKSDKGADLRLLRWFHFELHALRIARNRIEDHVVRGAGWFRSR